MRYYKASLILAILSSLIFLVLPGCTQGKLERLLLATTTSTDDSGLLDAILPSFESEYNINVDVIAIGTGQALGMGASGDVDILLVHAPEREITFVEAGDGAARYPIMFNDFVILGPEADPAGIVKAESAIEALALIADSQSIFISRGDDSGTHIKELSLWQAAGIGFDEDWYQSVGQGMGAVLTLADEQQAYTLSDRGTYLSRTIEGTSLVILFEGDPLLFNPYSLIPVNPETHSSVNDEAAMQFVQWLTSLETQQKIADFRVAGQPLFTPDSLLWREIHSD